MKRICCLLCSILMVFTLCCSPAFALRFSMDETTIMETAENYLSERMETIYLRTGAQVSAATARTLLDIAGEPAVMAEEAAADSEAALLGNVVDSVAAFAADNAPVLMSEMDRAISVDTMLGDLQCMEDMVAYKSYIFEDQNITFSDFDAQYHFGDIVIDGDYAVAEVYEELNYQYVDCDEPSYELGEFNVALVRIDGEWIIADVISDDMAFLAYCNTGYDLEAEITAYDEAMENAAFEVADTIEIDEPAAVAATTSSITYVKNNAVNYALTYTTQADDGTTTPTFRNTRFYWFGADCMNFCSQCVWAGFGGSNSWADIPAHQGMDEVSPAWWCDNSGQSSNGSWASCSAFRTYVSQSKSASTKGLICDSASISGSTNTLPYSASTLVGAVLHVEGYVGSTATAKAHAVFVNAATGNTRDTVMVCSYNRCRKNVKLSTVCAVGGTTRAIETIVPKTFQGGETGLRIYGDLLNAIVTHTATRTLSGHSNTTLSSFEMVLLKPNGGQAQKWTATNTKEISATYSNWDMAGEWSLKLTGTTSSGASMTWYGTIRVV